MFNKKDEDPETTKALELLALKLAQGINIDDEIDALLNTKMPDRDLEIEMAWERGHRPGEINEEEIDAKIRKIKSKRSEKKQR
jgi:uncharacterized protein YqfA (UPF0365 family)